MFKKDRKITEEELSMFKKDRKITEEELKSLRDDMYSKKKTYVKAFHVHQKAEKAFEEALRIWQNTDESKGDGNEA